MIRFGIRNLRVPLDVGDPKPSTDKSGEPATKCDVIFNPAATAKVIIAPEPQVGNPSSVQSYEGISVRVTTESSINDATSGDAEWILFDVFVGGRVLVPNAGVVMQG
jgi:hypothetical protein